MPTGASGSSEGVAKSVGISFPPDLEKHVAERAARKASILKEQRKAQEERQLLRKDKKVNKE